MKSDFVIQNDLPLHTKRKFPVLNSGFYRVRSTPVTIQVRANNQLLTHCSDAPC